MRPEELYKYFLAVDGISTDTRTITSDCMFFALKGPNFDANQLAEEALKKGAKYAVMDNPKLITDSEKMLLVPDVLTALQGLASYHRHQIGLPIIALTGSNGKTTTKELIHAVLSKKYNTTATVGNLNNHIGVPLTLLSISEEADLAIVEMGANHQKEIEQLCEITLPDYGYITNFGKAHLEGFGGVEGVIKGKSELYDYLRENHKTVFVNADDTLQVEKSIGIDAVSFGINNPSAKVIIKEATAQPMVKVVYKGKEIQSQLTGKYNISNICAAIAIGEYFGVAPEEIQSAIEEYKPKNNRSQWMTTTNNKLLLDAYNANPSSMAVAVENFAQLSADNKMMILGDMFELGVESENEHLLLVEKVKQTPLSCYFVGKQFYQIKQESENLQFFEDFDILKKYLENEKTSGKTILIKGSRGMSLERLIDLL
ncbi:UDP-N-acetylmuramoyl-tripeptide--D-alanyl-D-alanine ligase [Capnocytophaga sp. ARDL2]|uniref:UDP-N-acetylmuramoyl-tripeptide--D-alanyl-D- alanine ligase n=1 Tax=Capnocytophaga sp. ARDL2 TaxID=3238809 RepID=UPI003557AC5B